MLASTQERHDAKVISLFWRARNHVAIYIRWSSWSLIPKELHKAHSAISTKMGLLTKRLCQLTDRILQNSDLFEGIMSLVQWLRVQSRDYRCHCPAGYWPEAKNHQFYKLLPSFECYNRYWPPTFQHLSNFARFLRSKTVIKEGECRGGDRRWIFRNSIPNLWNATMQIYDCRTRLRFLALVNNNVARNYWQWQLTFVFKVYLNTWKSVKQYSRDSLIGRLADIGTQACVIIFHDKFRKQNLFEQLSTL